MTWKKSENLERKENNNNKKERIGQFLNIMGLNKITIPENRYNKETFTIISKK